MTTSYSYLKEIFPEPAMVAIKRQNFFKDIMIRAKIPIKCKHYEKRKIFGMKKCNVPCPISPFVEDKKVIKATNFTLTIRNNVNCQISNIIYIKECNIDQCQEKYIRETDRNFKVRISEHIEYIKSKINSQIV